MRQRKKVEGGRRKLSKNREFNGSSNGSDGNNVDPDTSRRTWFSAEWNKIGKGTRQRTCEYRLYVITMIADESIITIIISIMIIMVYGEYKNYCK